MYYLNDEMIENMKEKMILEEKSLATISKYLHDIRVFYAFMGEEKAINKEKTIEYKNYLSEHFKVSSANSMIAALNYFLKMNGWLECCVKSFKVQESMFRSSERELTRQEYYRLLDTAMFKGKKRLYYIMLTLGMTGIRISELGFITVSAVRNKKAVVHLKGKYREVLLPQKLSDALTQYIHEEKIISGSLFINKKTGKNLDRGNILRQMKAICADANVDKNKVFPHNFRHLFAVSYLEENNDLVHLADILGHSNINTTRRYTKVSPEEHFKQLDLMDLFHIYKRLS